MRERKNVYLFKSKDLKVRYGQWKKQFGRLRASVGVCVWVWVREREIELYTKKKKTEDELKWFDDNDAQKRS